MKAPGAGLGLVLAIALALAGCSSGAAATSPSGGALTIFGAASLKGVLEKAKSAYETAVPGARLAISTDSSATLETQIEQGAPADVFLAADTRTPQMLIDGGFVAGGLVPFATNELAIVVPADNPARIRSPADLARAGIKVIAAGDAVPISAYAAQLVQHLAGDAGYPAGFAAAYRANVVSMEDNVRAVISKIELGEGDAGIVYATDARASGKVATVEIPASANVRVTYAGVVVRDSKDQAAATAFLDWLAGSEGQAILGGFGFLPVR